MIAPLDVGQQTNVRPWMILDQAWVTIANMYPWRGRLRKRWGTQYMGADQFSSRVRVQVGTYSSQTSPVPGSVFSIGQTFTVGSDIFTVWQTGTPAAMKSTNPNASGTFNTTTGAFVITYSSGAPAGATPVYWYPGQPIMGMNLYQSASINDEPTIAFDTQFAYQFSGGAWNRIGSSTSAPAAGIWSGTNSQFFWGTNYRGSSAGNAYLFVTNNNATDGIQYWDSANWNQMTITTSGTPTTVSTALIIVPFHNRLVLLNTIEGGTNFATRARFSAIGNPIENSGSSYFPWYDNPNAANWIGGGFEDNIQTQQPIVSAQFIKDRLIVFFESSVWELAYTGNQILPFRWYQLNTELGANAPFATVPFDKEVITFGNVGIHQCNGSNVQRIDQMIPNTVFNINNQNSGPQRVWGIRDYFFESVYWIYPSSQNSVNANTFPNQILVYNYQNQSWATFDDSYTALGFFEQQSDITWGTDNNLWSAEGATWAYPNLNAQQLIILAGNQEGFIVKINQNLARNIGALSITNITSSGATATLTIENHNLYVEDIASGKQAYLLIENINASDPYAVLNGNIYPISSVTDANTIVIFIYPLTISGTYLGGGTVARVSNINLLSKPWNPYAPQGKNIFLEKIEFNVDATSAGEMIVDYYPSFTNVSMLDVSSITNIIGNNKLETFPYSNYYPLEAQAVQLWHPVYFQSVGETIQINIYMNDDEMANPLISLLDIQIHAIELFTQPLGRLQ